MTYEELFTEAGYNCLASEYYRHSERPIDIFLGKNTGVDIIDEDQKAIVRIRPTTLKAIMANAIVKFWVTEEEINDWMEQRNK